MPRDIKLTIFLQGREVLLEAEIVTLIASCAVLSPRLQGTLATEYVKDGHMWRGRLLPRTLDPRIYCSTSRCVSTLVLVLWATGFLHFSRIWLIIRTASSSTQLSASFANSYSTHSHSCLPLSIDFFTPHQSSSNQALGDPKHLEGYKTVVLKFIFPPASIGSGSARVLFLGVERINCIWQLLMQLQQVGC